MADEVTYDDETFNEGQEERPDADHFEQHDDKECHFIDDFAWADEERLPIPEKAPRMSDVVKVIERAIADGHNPVVFRFALTYVDAENGHLQVITNPRMSGPACVNLLTRSASILSYQEAQAEEEANAMLMGGLGKALKMAVQGQGHIPDLSRIFGHSGQSENDTDEQTGQYL